MNTDETSVEGIGFEITWGFQTTQQLRNNPQNVVIPIGDCELEGFTYDLFTEYKQPSVKRTADNGRITVKAPVSGAYYPAVMLYDGAGKEAFRLSIDGEEKGVIKAEWDDNKTYVFVLQEPVSFRGGEEIKLETLTSEGTYRTEDMLLLKEKPAPRQRSYEITHVEAQLQEDGSAVITCITNWDVVAKVEYGSSSDYGESVSEKESVNNHRLIIADIEPDRLYHYRIVAETDEGEVVVTPDTTFSTKPKELAKGKPQITRLPLTTTHSLSSPQFVPPEVTSGVAFPGDVFDPAHIRLLCNDGEIPLQVKVLSRYPDGSIRWALLDFQLQGSQTEYTLEYGSQVQRSAFTPENPVRISADEDNITVDTGRLRMVMDKNRGAIFNEIRMDGALVTATENPAGLTLVDIDGKSFTTTGPPEEVIVLEEGPLRGALLVKGKHRSDDGKSLFTYEFELHFYAGFAGIKLFHTWGNDDISDDFTAIKSLSLRIPALTGESMFIGNELGSSCSMLSSAGDSLTLEQYYDDKFQILENGAISCTGKRAAGWISSERVTVLARNFWQTYPKTLRVDQDGIEIGIMPPLQPDQYTNREEPEYRLYYYLKDGVYKLRSGVTKRHEFWILPSEAVSSLSQGEFSGSAMATAPPEWYAESGAMGRFVPAVEHTDFSGEAAELVRTYDEAVEKGLQGYLANREQNHEYGMLNFGDWWGERGINWGNIEYDTQHAFFLQFVRNGDFRYFLAGEAAERHHMDVDTVWYGRNRGLVYAHCIGHTGNYYLESPVEGQGSPRGGFSISHTWVEGHLDYYFLTGDRRALEAAEMVAHRYDSDGTRNYDFMNCRTPGWHLILSMAMYRATNDSFYLNAAHIVVDRVLERQTPDGGWQRQMMPGHCRDLPRHRGNAGFMVGVLMSGLKYYHEVTENGRVADSIVKAAHFVIDDMWVPKEHGFRYTSCPNTSPSPGLNSLIIEGIAYANLLKPDAKLKENLKAQIEHFRGVSSFGKSLSQHTRSMPKTLADLISIF